MTQRKRIEAKAKFGRTRSGSAIFIVSGDVRSGVEAERARKLGVTRTACETASIGVAAALAGGAIGVLVDRLVA